MNRQRQTDARKSTEVTPCERCKFSCKDMYYCKEWAGWFRKRWPIVCDPFRERMKNHERLRNIPAVKNCDRPCIRL